MQDDRPDQPLDEWLAHYFDARLSELDAACAGAGPRRSAVPRPRRRPVGASRREYARYSNIRALLPELPERSLQMRWNGTAGLQLINQGKAFYVRAKERFSRSSAVALED